MRSLRISRILLRQDENQIQESETDSTFSTPCNGKSSRRKTKSGVVFGDSIESYVPLFYWRNARVYKYIKCDSFASRDSVVFDLSEADALTARLAIFFKSIYFQRCGEHKEYIFRSILQFYSLMSFVLQSCAISVLNNDMTCMKMLLFFYWKTICDIWYVSFAS